jgi:hypothetical protein
MAGTQGTPLPKKLGIKPGQKVCLLNAPGAFQRDLEANADARIGHDLRLPPVDMVVLFVDRLADLERRFADITARLHPEGGFWVVWPKNASRRSTDITEDVVRRIARVAGMVDNKECAIDDVWSGVRLVLREENREAIAYRAIPPELSRRTRRPTAPARMAHRTSANAHGAGSSLRRARARATK